MQRIHWLITFYVIVCAALLQQHTKQAGKLDLHIELLSRMSLEDYLALEYALNTTTTRNSSLRLHLATSTLSTGTTTDVFQYASSILNKVVVFLDTKALTQTSCMISSFTRTPLVSLHSMSREHWTSGQCSYAMSISSNDESYGYATRDILRKNPQWKKIIILHDLHKSFHTGNLQHILASDKSRLVLMLMERRLNESTSHLASRIWSNIVIPHEVQPHAVVPLIRDDLITELLQKHSCYLKTQLSWIIQGELPINLTSHGIHTVISFRLPVHNTTEMQELINVIRNTTNRPVLEKEDVKDSTFLAHDALILVAKAASDVILDNRWNSSMTSSVPSTHGELLKEYITKTQLQGITGRIIINKKGDRDVTELEVLNLRNNKLISIGKWKSPGEIVLYKEPSPNIQRNYCQQPSLKGHTLRITTVEVHPFVIQYKKADGTIAYRGYCIDVLDLLSRKLGFKYVISYSPDAKYGARINGEWNGMVKQLMEKGADMAVAALTVTEDRESAVDFTVAYMHYTDDIILAKPVEKEDLFLFMSPLSIPIWATLCATVCVVALATYLLNFYCPYGWKNESGEKTAPQFSLFNSLWFSIACMLMQGAADRPKSLSGRILAGVYWFCILIWVSTYTANLAAFFTAKSAETAITRFQDIFESDYDVGVTSSSALYSFFMETKYENYQRLWYRMHARNTFPNNSMQGIEWARNRKYIHIADGPILKHAANQEPCNLMTSLSSPKGLGFALQPGSPYTKNMTIMLLHLREKGMLDERQAHWWVKNAVCPKVVNSLESKKVHLASMTGVYIVLGAGTVLAFMVLCGEILWTRNARDTGGQLAR